MSQMLIHLALTLPGVDWEIPWAGIGAFLLGAGSALSGIAAVMSARSAIKEKETHNDEITDDISSTTTNENTEDNTDA